MLRLLSLILIAIAIVFIANWLFWGWDEPIMVSERPPASAMNQGKGQWECLWGPGCTATLADVSD
jgi:hypothetical protein